MLKVVFTLLVFVSAGLAQSTPKASFSVHHAKHTNFSLSPAQMREAESLYQNACAVVQRDFHTEQLHPQIEITIGTDRNEVHVRAVRAEIWMTKWDPVVFAQGVVVLAFDQLLTTDRVQQLSARAIRYSSATVDVAGFK